MKKLIYPIIACSALAATVALAGGPDIMPAPVASVVPFMDFQLGAAWRDVDNITTPVFGAPLAPVLVVPGFNHSNDHFAGRVAGGLQFPITPVFKVTSELGFGYYNRDRFSQVVTFTPGAAVALTNTTNVKVSTMGYDAFVGGMYTVFNNVNLFGKVGGMVETYRTNFNNVTNVTGVGNIVNVGVTTERSSAVPAVMVGAQYEINQWLGIHVAYLHSFGSNLRLLQLGVAPAVPAVTFSRRLAAPTINAVFGGLEVRLPT